MQRRTWIIIAAVVLLVAAYFGWRVYTAPAADAAFKTAEVTRGDLEEVITANGTLNPVVLVNVGTQVSGTVRKLYVDFNDHVKQGQPLLELGQTGLPSEAEVMEGLPGRLQQGAAVGLRHELPEGVAEGSGIGPAFEVGTVEELDHRLADLAATRHCGR